MGDWQQIEGQRATVVEFHKDASGRFHPFSLTVIGNRGDRGYLSRDTYDIEWSREYGYLFHLSGFGGSGPVMVMGPYLTTGDVEVEETPCALVDPEDSPPWRGKKTSIIRKRNRTRRLRALPKAFAVGPGRDILDWLQRHAIEDEAVFCTTCRDWFPADWPCEHIWWCDKNGWWSTPSDRCGCKDREECYG